MEASINQKDWEGAARDAGNLSELYLTLGDISKAVAYARQSVDFADRSGDAFLKETARTWEANARLQNGEIVKAKELFSSAEKMQAKRTPSYPYLYSQNGFQFCDLLFSQGKAREVLERAKQTLEWAKINQARLYTFALDKLSLGRAYLLQARAEGKNDYKQAQDYLNATVTGLRDAAYQEFIARGLFARATLY